MEAIVVIAGSVGSFEPLKRILGAVPSGCAASIFVVSHIGPHRSILPSLLARPGGPSIGFPADGDPIVAGQVYVAPPDRHMTIDRGTIRLSEGAKVHHTRPGANPLFISAAERYGPHVMGVVLSGGDGDGAEGLRRIKERGGIALVQHPEEAEQPSMPLRAILADHPDAVLSINDIAEWVEAFCRSAAGQPNPT